MSERPLTWGELQRHPVWRWLPATAAVHAVLPVLLAGLWWAAGPVWVGQALVALHVGMAVVFVGSLPWWWRHLGDVVLLVLVDHVVTFVVVAALTLVA